MEKANVDKVLAPVRDGTVAPGSKTGQSLIRDALQVDPERTAELIRPIDRAALREGMRGLGLPERRVAELLRVGEPGAARVNDPFPPLSGSDSPTPFEDPATLISRGPVPPWAR